MKIEATKIPGAFLVTPDIFPDERGIFVKLFHASTFAAHGLVTTFEESFYSINKKDVVRGMHLQLPPSACAKLVYVSQGRIRDVILDLRPSSPAFRQSFAVELTTDDRQGIYIPAGCAHGFHSLEDETHVVYLQEKVRSAEHEAGVKFDSFGFDWGMMNPIMSPRDRELSPLSAFNSPFV